MSYKCYKVLLKPNKIFPSPRKTEKGKHSDIFSVAATKETSGLYLHFPSRDIFAVKVTHRHNSGFHQAEYLEWGGSWSLQSLCVRNATFFLLALSPVQLKHPKPDWEFHSSKLSYTLIQYTETSYKATPYMKGKK